jgi:hypothetical protein
LFSLKTKFGKTQVDGFPSFMPQKWQIQLGDLATKSPCRFLSLSLKIKWVTVYQLRHKIDGRIKMAQDTSRDLATCFVKQVRVGVFSLASRLIGV